MLQREEMNFHYGIIVNSSGKKKSWKQRIRATKQIYSDGSKNEYMAVGKRDGEKNLFVIANRTVSMPRVRD